MLSANLASFTLMRQLFNVLCHYYCTAVTAENSAGPSWDICGPLRVGYYSSMLFYICHVCYSNHSLCHFTCRVEETSSSYETSSLFTRLTNGVPLLLIS